MWSYNVAVEEMREREYPQLKGNAYLDHGGTTLPAKSMIDAFAQDISTNLYGNPHSHSRPSHIAGQRIDDIRERALRFFHADPKDFDLIFVSNATAAIKLVMECFRDSVALQKKSRRKRQQQFWYGYHKDSHNSVVGVREHADSHRCFLNDADVDSWISDTKALPRNDQLGLFAYPGQSNMTGRRLPLDIPDKIRYSSRGQNVYSLLDAAALATTTQLELDTVRPDFTSISFYKLFGFPNLGALIVRKAAAPMLMKRAYFGGGTVEMVTTIGESWHELRDQLHERLEDGTLPFHSIFALDAALTAHTRLFTSMTRVSGHTSFLVKYLFDNMVSITHSNFAPVFVIYKDNNAVYGDTRTQGATVAFNIAQPDGSLVGYSEVERTANDKGIFVRSGSMCNPGGVATHLGWLADELRTAYTMGLRCSNSINTIMGRATGVVRVSLGAMSTISDVDAFLRHVEETYVDVFPEVEIRKPTNFTLKLGMEGSVSQLSLASKPKSWHKWKPSFSKLGKSQIGVVTSI